MEQNLCKQYLIELHKGTHDWANDQMKLALYLPGAVLDPDTIAAYTATDETAGVGYAAGGFALVTTMQLSATSTKMIITFNNLFASPALFSTRKGLIYNSSKANKAVAVLDWGYDYIATVAFTLGWPPFTDSQAIIRLGA